MKKLYLKFTAAAARVLRPGGRLVVQTPSRKNLRPCFDPALWAEDVSVMVNCGGCLVSVCVWRRSTADAQTSDAQEPAPGVVAAGASRSPLLSTTVAVVGTGLQLRIKFL